MGTLHTTCPFIMDKAHLVKALFDQINKCFYTVHCSLSHTKRIYSHQIPAIKHEIDTYITTFQSLFPGKLLPKHHILHKHCIPHIERHGFGLGLMGEQGTEASHQTIARIAERARAMRDEKKKLKFIMETHYLGVAPSLRIQREKRHRKTRPQQCQ